MTQQYNSFSGQNYDKWVERNSNKTTFGKVQKQFWFTKSAVIRKLGKKEDEHVVASDAELDAKIELFKAIESSTKELQGLLADYQNKLCVLAQEENALGRMLKEYGKQDKNRAGKMMMAVGKSLSYTAQQRVSLRNPLVRLFQEVDTFHTRAVEDTLRTVTEMEKVRTEYRGALMWMKDISQDFNPDQYHQLEKFREVQVTVKKKKASFDKMKIKSLQKTDLLAASRCNMFSHALILYQNNLITFCEKTAKTLNNVATNFKGYHQYEFQVIKELAEPVIREDEEKGTNEENLQGDDKMFFDSDYHDSVEESKPKETKQTNKKNTNSDSLVNLLDISEPMKGSNTDSTQTDKKENTLDLLTNNPEVPDVEKDTQQMLKELFDSPVHQPLPVFGTDIPSNSEAIISHKNPLDEFNPFQLPKTEGKNPDSIFLPSQLLDFGIKEWPATNTLGSISSQQSTSSMTPAATSMQKPPVSQESSQKPQLQTNNTTSNGSKKVDWYKVFQDIDPLADPAGAIFGNAIMDDKKC